MKQKKYILLELSVDYEKTKKMGTRYDTRFESSDTRSRTLKIFTGVAASGRDDGVEGHTNSRFERGAWCPTRFSRSLEGVCADSILSKGSFFIFLCFPSRKVARGVFEPLLLLHLLLLRLRLTFVSCY